MNQSNLQPPGKYVFTTTSNEPKQLVPDAVTATLNESTGASTITLRFSTSNISMIVQHLPSAPVHEQLTVRLLFGRLPEYEQSDYVVRYSTIIKTGNQFYTDSNNLFLAQRTRFFYGNHVENNYYPVSRYAILKGNTDRLSVLVDRACGASSVDEGKLDIMVNRNSPFDDDLGVREANNEGKDLNILHRLLFEKIDPENPTSDLQYRIA